MARGGTASTEVTAAPAGPAGRLAPYAVAVAGVLAAAALRWTLTDLIDHVFVFFFPVVAIVALRGGAGPGLLATGLSTALSALWLMPGQAPGHALGAGDVSGLALFVAGGAAITVAAELYRATRRRLEALEREGTLREARARLEAAEAGQRRVDAAARLTQAQLEAVLSAMSDGVIVMDLARRPVLVNEALVRITGLPGAGVIRQELERVREHYRITTLDGVAVPHDQWPLTRALRGESVPPVELRARRDDTGQTWTFSFTCEPVRDEAGRQVLAVGVVRDISERVAAETASARQRALQDQLASLALAVPGAVFTLRRWPDGRMSAPFASPALEALLGFTPEALALDVQPALARVHPDDLAALLAGVTEGARTLTPIRLEYRYLHQTGGPRWLEVRAVPHAEPEGSTRFDGFVTDVTDRREAQEAVRALAARLQAAREEEAARIARDLHDDLGQTLTALQLELRWIEERVERMPASVEAGPLVDRVVAASELAANTLSAVQRLSQELHPVALDHLGLAAALRQELRRFQQRAGVQVSTALEADAPPGDPVAKALFRICQEALTNVARHAGALHVEVRLTAEPDAVVLQVTDDGRGLPADLAPSPASLGLLGMQERAHGLGGTLTVGPGPRGGTAVTARIPRPAPTPGA